MPKLCEYQNCFKRASYGYDKLERCNKHKEDRKYIDKKCQCGEKLPTFNLPGEKKAICCSSCKTDDMVDVTNKKCPNCIDWVDPIRGNKKYKGYCTRCYEVLFPTDPLTFQIRSKTKEIAVRDFINTNYAGFHHDEPFNYTFDPECPCTSKRRIDHFKLINNTVLCIETDENQHKYYNELIEEKRYTDIYTNGGLMCHYIFIRFNPDKYKNKKNKNKNPEIATRLRELQKVLDTQIERISNEENSDLVEIIYLYYDNYN